MRALTATVGLALAACFFAGSAQAQVGYRDGSGSTVFRCQSNDNRQTYCRIPGGAPSAQLVQQLSRSACIRNQTWGVDRGGVWVAGGCRADFVAAGYGYGDDDRYRDRYNNDPRYGGSHQLFRCESNDGRYRQCNAGDGRRGNRGNVQLVRQLSRTACVEGQTWGSNRMGVWVDRGCRGEFVFNNARGYRDDRYRPYPVPYPGDRYDDRYNGARYGAPDLQARSLRCESRDGNTARCGANVYRGVQVARQLSQSPCIEGRTWGWSRNEIWVSQGCRADFNVW